MAAIDDLRKQARKRTRDVSKKIDRLLQQKGVFIQGSDFDVRKRPSELAKMRTRDLNAYLKRLDNFMSRDTQFVAGHMGAPLPRKMVVEYLRYETARNIRYAKHKASNDDVFIEPAQMTIAQRNATTKAKTFNVLSTGGAYLQWDEHTRNIANIPSAQALKILTDYEKKALKSNHINSIIDLQKANHIEFLERKGEPGLANIIRKMNRKQFDVLRNFTDYLQKAEYVYLTKDSSTVEGQAAKMRDDNIQDAEELALWASKIK